MKNKHGRIVEWEDLFVEEYGKYTNPKVQKATAEDGTVFIHVFIPIAKHEIGRNFAHYVPSWEALKAINHGLVEIYGTEEVEKELNIKIGGEENGNGI